MDDFGVLARDFGYKPQGKSAPMAPKSNSGFRSEYQSSSSFRDDHNHDGALFNDVFGGPPKYTRAANNSESSDFDYDSIFKSSSTPAASESKTKPSGPVYDKPVYDEDIFDGLPGMKTRSESSSARFDNDVFASISSPPKENRSAPFDDFLGNLNPTEKSAPKNRTSERGFDDLLPGFGVGSPSSTNRDRPLSNSSRATKVSADANKPSFDEIDDPFVVLESTSTPAVSSSGLFTDPLDEISKLGQAGNSQDGSPISENVFADINPNGFGKSVPGASSERNYGMANGSPSRTGSTISREQVGTEQLGGRSFRDSGRHSKKSTDGFQESYNSAFDMPSISTDSHKPVGQAASQPYKNAEYFETNSYASRESEEDNKSSDDVWLTVAEIPLFTQPTSAPPPSRPPPRIPGRVAKSESGFVNFNSFKKGYEFPSSPSSTQQSQSSNPARSSFKSTPASQVDDLENFSMSGTRNNVDEYGDTHSGEEGNPFTSAAASADAMKEAMDRAEAKFRHAKEVREREYVKTARSKDDTFSEKEGNGMQDDLEKLDREQKQKEEERERRRLEKEQERAREREMARQAVERATREARERAAAEARERASADARMKAEKAAVQRAQAEARERAERAAVQRVQAEARERAAAEAKERAEKVAADARERANAEAREKEMRDKAAASKAEAEARRRAERAAVERAAAEARGRAAAEARDRAAAAASAARMNQQKADDDFESFFSTASRPSSVPRPRTNSSETVLDPQFQSKGGTDAARRTSSVGTSSNIRKTSSATNIVDDLSSIFGGAPSSGSFQEVEGETEERRRARLERHQRTQERAAKAVAEKNQRDLQAQREQEERYRMAGTLDTEIKRWSAGKEGNLRALLSTLQYVLWPECGWQPVSLTDLITGASVKKAYRKATLCIHPDKVQQKGASLQQKYVAEKVFDLLKEAWNKFNSEELF